MRLRPADPSYHRDRGSVLVLVPVGFLVLMILGALAVDSAATYLAQQQLHDALSAAATDAVTAALDRASFYGGGTLDLDPPAAGRTVCLDLLAQGDTALHDVRVWMAVDGDSIHLSGQAVTYAVFGKAIPGYGSHTVSSSASAVAASGPLPAETAAATAPPPVMTPLDCART